MPAMHKSMFALLAAGGLALAAAPAHAQPAEAEKKKPAGSEPEWLYVVSGTGTARVSGRTVRLREGSLLLIGKREPHQIRNTGRDDLVTVNVYVPPAYGADGEPLR